MLRALSLTLAATLLTTTPALAQSTGLAALSPDIAGDWELDGVHEELGSYRGVLTFHATGQVDLWTYERDRSYDRGGSERDAGTARLVADRLELDGQTTGANPQPRSAVFSREGASRVLSGRASEAGRDLCWQRLERRLADNGRLTFLIDGPTAFPTFRQLYSQAQESIHIEIYKWNDDATGRALADAVMDRARAGVQVRILTDTIGSRGASGMFKDMRAAGCEVIVGNGILGGVGRLVSDSLRSLWGQASRIFGGAPPHDRESRTVLNRDHCKVIVIDGERGLIGSMNYAEEHEHHYHDVHFIAEGNLVHILQRQFMERWLANDGALPADLAFAFKPMATRVGDTGGRGRKQLPGLFNEIKEMYLTMLRDAQSEVFIETPYLLDDDIIAAMQAAARRGVQVRVIIPNDSDHAVKPVRDALAWVMNDIVRSGVQVYKYRGRMTHAKLAARDDAWSTVGSSNLDWTSTRHNVEFNLELFDPQFAQELEARVFGPDIANSDAVQERKLKWYEKLRSGAFRLARKFL